MIAWARSLVQAGDPSPDPWDVAWLLWGGLVAGILWGRILGL